MGVTFGLLAALCFGSGDFLGGQASMRAPTRVVLAVSQAVAAAGGFVLLVVLGGVFDGHDVAFGAAAGLVNAIGLGVLYRSLAAGRMAIVAPLAAVTGAVVPVGWGLLTGERPSTIALAGVVVAVVAAALVAREEGQPLGSERDASPRLFGVAIFAGVMLGASFVLFTETSTTSGLWPVVAARVMAFAAALAWLVATKGPDRLRARRLPGDVGRPAVGAGACDVVATACLLTGIRHDLAVVVAPVAALAPGFTVVWARLVLREPVGRIQAIGIGLALVALALLASQ